MHTPRWEESLVRATVPRSRSAARPPRQRHWRRLGDASVPAPVAPAPPLLLGNQQPCPCPHVSAVSDGLDVPVPECTLEALRTSPLEITLGRIAAQALTASPLLVARSICAQRRVTLGTGKADEDERD
jgi:hypothetical protein